MTDKKGRTPNDIRNKCHVIWFIITNKPESYSLELHILKYLFSEYHIFENICFTRNFHCV